MTRSSDFTLTEETRTVGGKTLFRVRYADGRLGGFVQSKDNLDGGFVLDDACVMDNSIVRDCAAVKDSAVVSGQSVIGSFALVTGRAAVRSSIVGDFAVVGGDADVHDSTVRDHGCVLDHAFVVHSTVFGFASVRDSAVVRDSMLDNNARAESDAKVRGVRLAGGAAASSGAQINDPGDILTLHNNWSSRRDFTAYRDIDGRVRWCVGCFRGTSAELVEKAYGDSKLSGDCYAAAVDFAKRVFRALAEDRRRRLAGDVENENKSKGKKGETT